MNKNKTIKQILLVFISIIMMMNINGPVFAADVTNPVEDEIISEYVNIDSINASIFKSGVNAHCVTIVEAKSRSKITVNQYLERKDGSIYKPIYDWSSSTTGTYLEVENVRVINILKHYRLRARITVGSETVTIYRYLD